MALFIVCDIKVFRPSAVLPASHAIISARAPRFATDAHVPVTTSTKLPFTTVILWSSSRKRKSLFAVGILFAGNDNFV